MQFAVDAARLGVPVEAPTLGLAFQPPVGWEPLDAAALDSVGRVLARSLPDLPLQPRYVFLDSTTQSLMSVASVTFSDSLAFADHVAAYGAALAERFPADSVRQAEFMKEDLHVAQFLVQPQGRVTFKLLVATVPGEVVQVDYIVPAAHYPGQVKAIESSIGSIHRINGSIP